MPTRPTLRHLVARHYPRVAERELWQRLAHVVDAALDVAVSEGELRAPAETFLRARDALFVLEAALGVAYSIVHEPEAREPMMLALHTLGESGDPPSKEDEPVVLAFVPRDRERSA